MRFTTQQNWSQVLFYNRKNFNKREELVVNHEPKNVLLWSLQAHSVWPCLLLRYVKVRDANFDR